jgi:TrpR-related protein YerC/YecD
MLDHEKNTLYTAILQLKTTEECASFLRDLCTPSEIAAMSDRFRVARLLDQHTLSYREIHQKTGVSLATIGRVARFLSQETYHGYRLVLDRLKHK